MITLRIMLRENNNNPEFKKIYLDTLPAVPRIGEKLEFGVERFVVYDVSYSVPFKVISVMATQMEDV